MGTNCPADSRRLYPDRPLLLAPFLSPASGYASKNPRIRRASVSSEIIFLPFRFFTVSRMALPLAAKCLCTTSCPRYMSVSPGEARLGALEPAADGGSLFEPVEDGVLDGGALQVGVLLLARRLVAPRLAAGLVVPRLLAEHHALDGHEHLHQRTVRRVPRLAGAPGAQQREADCAERGASRSAPFGDI